MSAAVVIKHGISCEAKVADIPVSEHRFWVISHGGKEYRVDVGVMAGSDVKRRIFTARLGREIVIKGSAVKPENEIVEALISKIAEK